MLHHPAIAALATVVALAACASGGSVVSSEEISLRAASTSFAADEPLDLELWNRSASALGYNACSGLILERRTSPGQWERVSHQPPGSACTLQLDRLDPGRSTLVRIPRQAGFDAGAYRVRMHVEWPLGDGRVEVRSLPFGVGEFRELR